MNKEDFGSFVKAIDFAHKVIRKPAIDEDEVLKAWFVILAKYSLKQVTDSLNVVVTHPQSRYGIDPALIVECMGIEEEKELTWRNVIALARNPVTPIGVLARMKIKSFNLNEYKDRDLQHLAEEFLDTLPETKARALSGKYTRHEVAVMIERGVRPSAPFMEGMPEYKPLAKDDPLLITFEAAKKSDYYRVVKQRQESARQNGLPVNKQGQLKVLNELKGLLNNDNAEQQADDKAVFDEMMGRDDV